MKKPADLIKQARREAQFRRAISQLIAAQAADDASLRELFVNRVSLSADRSICTVFFFTDAGKERFDELLPNLILYKPSLRAALAREIPGRYAPDLVFRFDDRFEKHQALEALLEKVKETLPKDESNDSEEE